MPIERKPLSEQEWKLYRVVRTPSAFSEFTRPAKKGKPFRLWKRQIIEVNREEKRKKRVQARDLGKSVTASDEFKRECVLWPDGLGGVALFGSRQESNLQPLFETELVIPFKTSPFLRLFLPDPDNSINRKTWEIRLANGAVIRGRIQGKDGAGFNSIHPNIAAWFDEVQLLSDEAVKEMLGMLNADLPVLCSGVPNGVRSSFAWRIDNDPSYGFAGARMSRLDDPRVTPEFIDLLKREMGEDSSAYKQQVLGEWGADARMTFDLDRIVLDLPLKPGDSRSVKPAFYRSVEVSAADVVKPDGTARTDVLAARFAFRGDMPKTDKVWFHADHGQSASPTTLYIAFWDIKEKCWRQYHRVLLVGMEAPTQASVIDWLAREIHAMSGVKPIIGMDTTGQGGGAVMASLQPQGWELMRVNLSENTQDGLRPETDEELKKRLAKDPFAHPEKQMVPNLQKMRQVAYPRLAREFYAGRARLVSEDILVKQLGAMTDHENKTGTERVYECDFHLDGVPYNHDASAMEIFGAMLHNLDTRQEIKPPDLWVQEMPVSWGSIN